MLKRKILNVMLMIIAFSLVSSLVFATGSRQSVVTVAAHNSNQKTKMSADFVCDGMHDGSIISQAIISLPETGGSVILTEGEYDLNITLAIIRKSKVKIIGQGENTILKYNQSGRVSIIEIRNSSEIILEDFIIDGTRARQAHHGIEINNMVTKSELRNITIKNLAYGSGVSSDGEVNMYNTKVINCSHGIGIDSKNIIIANCEVRDCKANSSCSSFFVQGDKFTFIGNKAINNNGRGIGGMQISCNNSLISNNISRGNSSHNISIYGSDNVIVNNFCRLDGANAYSGLSIMGKNNFVDMNDLRNSGTEYNYWDDGIGTITGNRNLM